MTGLTLAQIAEHPQLLTQTIMTAEGETLILRPLAADDVDKTGQFLSGLSTQTRHFSTFSGYDTAAAQALCESIARYDKLRFVIEAPAAGRIIGMLEFSMDITPADQARYTAYGVPLDPVTDCRFGPTLADDYQNKGIGSRVFPFIMAVARRFGQQRIILWGGVLADNQRAIRYYEKVGFRALGRFTTVDQLDAIDMILNL